MSDTTLNLQYKGTDNGVKVYNDGALAIHTKTKNGQAEVHIFSLRGGPIELRTLAKLEVKVLQGPCVIKVGTNQSKTLQPTSPLFSVPAGSTFTIEGDAAVLKVTPKAGPGFGSDTGVGGSLLD